MTSTFQRYVEKIVQQTDTLQDEKDDLREEFLIHLELSYAELMKEGYSDQQAKQAVLENFGASESIGDEIQQAMFPYRKAMMLTLAVTSLLFSFTVYLSQLFLEGDAYIAWLLLSIVVSTCLLTFTLQPMSLMNRRLWINSLLLIHVFSYLFGMLMATSVESTISIPLTFLSWFIVLLAIALIYRTTIFDYQSSRQTLKKQVRILHALNMTAGIFIIAGTLFFLWAVLAFTSFELSPFVFLIFVPLLIWLVSYITAMQLIAKKKKIAAYVISTIPLLTCLYLLINWFWVI